MRSSLLLLIAAGLTLGALLSCDVDAALLRGAPEAYHFPPSVPTDSFEVDADKIHLFQLTSQAVPEHDVVEAKIWAVLCGRFGPNQPRYGHPLSALERQFDERILGSPAPTGQLGRQAPLWRPML